MSAEEKNPVDAARKWLAELKFAKREDEAWVRRAKKIVKRYRDERSRTSDNNKRYNILWANIQTMLPALYGKTPRAQVERRNKDQDPIGRTASQILERALQYEIDHYGDFDASIKSSVLDRLLPGRGVSWVRFETKEVETIGDEAAEDEAEAAGLPEPQEYEYECTPVDYVFWEDFRYSPARCWDEVTWVARRVYMTRKEGVERFGEDFNDVPLTHEPLGLDELKNQGAEVSEIESLKKAQVWEIWCKSEKMVYWVAEGYQQTLDIKEDPYGLDNFWPCPRPLFATQTTDTLVPIPDYSLYQDQAEELDMLTNRIGMLVEAVKVVGVYDASQPAIARMMNEGVNNTLIPVDSFAAFAEKGGIKGTVDFLPLDMVIAALNNCYQAREQCKSVIYEITGLSDIIRGASVASETATAQQIKSQYASLRLRRLQTDVAQFASEVLRIKAQLMADLYSGQTLIEMSGIMQTQDAQFAEQAIQLLKSEPARNFRIEVAADSLVEMDEQAEKQSRVEFLQATGGFLQQALPMAQQVPEMAPLMAEMLLFGIRAFKGGRPLEAAFDTAMAQMTAPKPPAEPQPDPEQIKMQGQMQIEQAKTQSEQSLKQAELQNEQQIEQFRAQQALALEQMRQDAETQRVQLRAEMDAQTKLTIAQMQQQSAVSQMAGQEVSTAKDAITQDISALIQSVIEQLGQALGEQRQAVEQIAQTVNAPRKIVRDANGRAIGVEVNGVIREIQRGADGRAIGV